MSSVPDDGVIPPARPHRLTGERLARDFHKVYEELAPRFGYTTREASAVAWENLPDDNRALMVATCTEIIERWGLDL